MMPMILAHKLKPELLVGREISLEESIDALVAMDRFPGTGTTVVTSF
jgi:alcohol dehydrogenase